MMVTDFLIVGVIGCEYLLNSISGNVIHNVTAMMWNTADPIAAGITRRAVIGSCHGSRFSSSGSCVEGPVSVCETAMYYRPAKERCGFKFSRSLRQCLCYQERMLFNFSKNVEGDLQSGESMRARNARGRAIHDAFDEV